jgi:phosphoribosyl 1,2-cyclic phosphodiesterase
MSTGSVRVTFLGTRGSVPTPEPANRRHGGNTSCIQLETCTGRRLLLDAGTGIRQAPHVPGSTVDVFLTHFHWDHIQGLPFLPALHDPSALVRIHAPVQSRHGLEALLGDLLAPVYFPVAWHEFPATVELYPADGVWRGDGVEVRSLRVSHPSVTVGYRVHSDDVVVAYIPDNELRRDDATYGEVCDFVRDVDLLIHDAMLSHREHSGHRGWGHSTIDQAVRLARKAGARRLSLFHHHPARDDRQLDELLARTRRVKRPGLDLDMAREGETVTLAAVTRTAAPA